MSIALMKATLDTYKPDRMSEDDANGLELLLSLDAFSPLWEKVEEILEDFYDHLRNHPTCSFEKPKAKMKGKQKAAPQAAPKQAPEGLDPNRPIIWFQVDPKSGLLTPVK